MYGVQWPFPCIMHVMGGLGQSQWYLLSARQRSQTREQGRGREQIMERGGCSTDRYRSEYWVSASQWVHTPYTRTAIKNSGQILSSSQKKATEWLTGTYGFETFFLFIWWNKQIIIITQNKKSILKHGIARLQAHLFFLYFMLDQNSKQVKV